MKVLTCVTFVISDHKTSEPYPRLRGANLLSSSVAPLYHVCIIQPGRKRASISPVYNPRCPIPIDKNIAHVKIHVARDARNRTSGKTIPYCVSNDGLQGYRTSSSQTKLPSQRKNRKDRHCPRRSSCRYQLMLNILISTDIFVAVQSVPCENHLASRPRKRYYQSCPQSPY